MALGWTRPVTEISTRDIPVGKVRPARKTDNATAVCDPIVETGILDNHGLLLGYLYFYLLIIYWCHRFNYYHI
jgi:hypothetical protein